MLNEEVLTMKLCLVLLNVFMEGPTLHLTFVTTGKLIDDNEVYDYSHSFVCALACVCVRVRALRGMRSHSSRILS